MRKSIVLLLGLCAVAGVALTTHEAAAEPRRDDNFQAESSRDPLRERRLYLPVDATSLSWLAQPREGRLLYFADASARKQRAKHSGPRQHMERAYSALTGGLYLGQTGTVSLRLTPWLSNPGLKLKGTME